MMKIIIFSLTWLNQWISRIIYKISHCKTWYCYILYCLRCFFLYVSAYLTICLISMVNRGNAYFKWFSYWSTTTRWQRHDKTNWYNFTLPANPSANGSTVHVTLLSFPSFTTLSPIRLFANQRLLKLLHWPLAHCCKKMIKLLVLFEFLFLHDHSF
jgi:hypothetical protein